MTADGVHSLMDGAANVVGLVGLLVARRPPDANHPYGHRKYETFAALGIVAMMFLGCWEIDRHGARAAPHPHLPTVSGLGLRGDRSSTIAINAGHAWSSGARAGGSRASS